MTAPRRHEHSRMIGTVTLSPRPYERCMNCGDQVEAQPKDGGWVFPLDDRGFCADCRWMEEFELPDEHRKHQPKRRKRGAFEDARDEVTIHGKDFE